MCNDVLLFKKCLKNLYIVGHTEKYCKISY